MDIDHEKLRLELVRLRREFQKEEFIYLASCINQLVDEQFKLERNMFIGIAAIYAWLTTKDAIGIIASETTIGMLAKYSAWLAPTIVAFGMLRSVSMYITLEITYGYMRKIETSALGHDGGWQAFAAKQKAQLYNRAFRITLIMFWAVMFAATVFIALEVAPITGLFRNVQVHH